MVTRTRPANFLGMEDRTYVLCAEINDSLAADIQRIQQYIEDAVPGLCWFMPRHALHITVYELMQRGVFSVDKDAFFIEHQEANLKAIKDVLAGTAQMRLPFDTIEVSPDAVTLQSSDTDALNAIRAELTKRLILPADTKLPPTVVHCTIARFVRESDMNPVRECLRQHVVSCTQIVDSLQVRRTLVQPMQQYDVVAKFDLQ